MVAEQNPYFDPRVEDPRRRRRLLPMINECPLEPCCQRCNDDLTFCAQVLEGLVVEDNYHFNERSGDGVCYDIDRRAGSLDVFGPTKSFRDTPECRQLVQHYTCLWWASTNDAYRNNCDEAFATEVAKPPCRSFCSQIATQCANTLDYMDLCIHIACPPTDTECTPGPGLDSLNLNPNDECYTWHYSTPTDAAAPATPANRFLLVLPLVVLARLLLRLRTGP